MNRNALDKFVLGCFDADKVAEALRILYQIQIARSPSRLFNVRKDLASLCRNDLHSLEILAERVQRNPELKDSICRWAEYRERFENEESPRFFPWFGRLFPIIACLSLEREFYFSHSTLVFPKTVRNGFPLRISPLLNGTLFIRFDDTNEEIEPTKEMIVSQDACETVIKQMLA